MVKHKNVLITGASRGIGRSIAIEFAKNGYNLAINSSNSPHELMSLSNELIREYNVKCIPIVADVSNYESVKYLFNEFFMHYDTIDTLINNAGISHYGLLIDLNVIEWNKIISTNLSSAFNTCHFAVPKMISNYSGSIINISSIWGEVGASNEVAYSASKGGLNAFTKALAKELSLSNIRVNAISCGAIDTDMNSNLSIDEKNSFIDEIPLKRFGSPVEVAKLCSFLASEESKYITGQIITVDGGLII